MTDLELIECEKNKANILRIKDALKTFMEAQGVLKFIDKSNGMHCGNCELTHAKLFQMYSELEEHYGK